MFNAPEGATGNATDASSFVIQLAKIILNPTITLMFAIALLFFVWGLVEYIKGADEPSKRSEGAKHMFWGIIGFFIMFSAYAILELFVESIFG